MKIDPEERILRCLEGEILDRVPHMELGYNIFPSVKLTLYMDKMPIRLKNWLLRLKIYENAIQATKERLGLSDPVPKTLTRRALRLDSIASNLIQFPTSLEFMDAFNPFLFRIPIRFKIDMVPIMGFPSSIIRGRIRRRNKLYFISEDWYLMDVDDIGDLRGTEPYYLNPEEQMEKLIEAYQNESQDDKVEYIGKLRKSVEGKLAVAPQFNSIFESWHIIWGLSNMHIFFRDFSKEYRKGPPYGSYKRFLGVKAKFIADFVKKLSEKDIKLITLVEDVCEDNGPFLRTDQYKNFYVPEIKKIVDAAHKVGIKVFFHTDGKLKIRRDPGSF